MALAVVIAVAAIHRLIDPPDVDGGVVLVVALAGIVVNLAATMLLAGAGRRSLNVEGAFQHVLTDLFAFIATADRGRRRARPPASREADGIAALVVAALMLRSGCGLLRESGRVLLEAAPRDLDPQEIGSALAAAEPRRRGARPARMGGHLRLPGDLGARHGPRRLRHAGPPPRAGASCCATASA